MFSLKKIIGSASGYLILFFITIGANHHDANNIALGAKTYHERCEVCHGNQGDGKTFAANVLFPPPKNFTAEKIKTELVSERMIRSITKGRPNTAMMPWENVLSEHEIQAVVVYIRKELMKLKED